MLVGKRGRGRKGPKTVKFEFPMGTYVYSVFCKRSKSEGEGMEKIHPSTHE